MHVCDDWPITWMSDTSEVDPALKLLAVEAATDLLWALSGRRAGVCGFTEKYRMPENGGACNVPRPPNWGVWRHHHHYHPCCGIHLAHGPVQQITSVALEGTLMDADEYYLERGILMRDGHCWPSVTDLEPPVIDVVYLAGVPLPASTALALGEVAGEFVKGFLGQGCRLPSRAVNVSRQGVTVQMADPLDYLKLGLLGLPIADAWIRTMNPTGLKRASGVYTPDFARRAT